MADIPRIGLEYECMSVLPEGVGLSPGEGNYLEIVPVIDNPNGLSLGLSLGLRRRPRVGAADSFQLRTTAERDSSAPAAIAAPREDQAVRKESALEERLHLRRHERRQRRWIPTPDLISARNVLQCSCSVLKSTVASGRRRS